MLHYIHHHTYQDFRYNYSWENSNHLILYNYIEIHLETPTFLHSFLHSLWTKHLVSSGSDIKLIFFYFISDAYSSIWIFSSVINFNRFSNTDSKWIKWVSLEFIQTSVAVALRCRLFSDTYLMFSWEIQANDSSKRYEYPKCHQHQYYHDRLKNH